MLRDVIPMLLPLFYRTHLARGGGCLSTSTICDWQAIGVRKYDPDGPARVRDLFIYLAGCAPCTYDLYGSVYYHYVHSSGFQGGNVAR